jgi:NTP pyrophosphatase (non-canonical NTP hydrolase)
MLDRYTEFVDGVTSIASKDTEELIKQLRKLESQGVNAARLDTAFTGLASESGEALDLVKKLKFHGKDFTPEIREHLIKELGDVAWYFANGCMALGVSPEEVLERNVKKLEARYPGGKFDIHRSENRAEGDI